MKKTLYLVLIALTFLNCGDDKKGNTELKNNNKKPESAQNGSATVNCCY